MSAVSKGANEGNDEAIEAWNGVLFDKFVRFRSVLTAGFEGHGRALLDRFSVAAGARVLDIGCGFGDTTLAIARRVQPDGECVGTDAAARFVEEARGEAERAGVRNARFFAADAQLDPLGGPYDRVFSRFGTMFFASPVAAFRNIRSSLVPGGLLTMAVWRSKDENPIFSEPEHRVLAFVQPPVTHSAPTCGPGPFSMASPDLVSAQLKAAGFSRIGFERLDLEVRVGETIEHAIDFAMAMGPAGEVLRLASAEAERRKPEIIAALRELFAPMLREGGVFGASSSWLVSARS